MPLNLQVSSVVQITFIPQWTGNVLTVKCNDRTGTYPTAVILADKDPHRSLLAPVDHATGAGPESVKRVVSSNEY